MGGSRYAGYDKICQNSCWERVPGVGKLSLDVQHRELQARNLLFHIIFSIDEEPKHRERIFEFT